ncbi:MAG: hypothetical protein J7M26_10445, partial [Armatimonadetes bacterium]|nr:hypothetical protein [Armatimonadota bacterium]
MMPAIAVLKLCALVLTVPTQFSFDGTLQGWQASSLDPGSSVSVVSQQGHDGVLRIAGTTPPSLGAAYRPWDDWRAYQWLSFDLFIPKDAPDDLSVYVYVKDKQYWWYQTPVLQDALTGMRRYQHWRGRWLSVRLDISRRSAIWQ